MVKNPPASAGDKRDVGPILALGRPPGVGNGKQYSCRKPGMNELDKSGQDIGGSLRNKSNQAKAKKK